MIKFKGFIVIDGTSYEEQQQLVRRLAATRTYPTANQVVERKNYASEDNFITLCEYNING